MKYISLATHNSELIVINDMDAFTTHFCYSKKQRHGKIDVPVPGMEITDDADMPQFEAEETDMPNEDDL